MSREAFERWFRKEYQIPEHNEIDLTSPGTSPFFIGWQASRADVLEDLAQAFAERGLTDSAAAIRQLKESP